MRSVRLIARFYSSLFLADALVTISCIWLWHLFGNRAHLYLPVLFWYKVIATILIFYLGTHNKKQEFYYYQNLGISKLKLVISTTVFDISLCMVLLLNIN